MPLEIVTKSCLVKSLGIWSLVCLFVMFAGTIGTNVFPKSVFGIFERMSTFSAVIFNAILGWYLYMGKFYEKDVWEELNAMGIPSVIAPPFYMGGVQALTRHFSGTFTFSKETIMRCIEEYFENLDRFGFQRVVVFNDHGDGFHISAIIEAIKNANRKLKLKAYWMEYENEWREHGFSGEEDYILKLTTMPFEEMFQMSGMPEDEFDVHAGAFETATMREIYPEAVREEKLMELEPTFLKGE